MTERRPPALAAWLLDRLGYTLWNPALAGDLQEEFLSGRSGSWYWRQTLMVMVTGASRNATVLKPYLKAYIAGFALQLPVIFALWRLAVPSQVHGAGKVALTVLALACGYVLLAAGKARVTGQSFADLKLLLCTSGGTRVSPSIARFAALETFATYLMTYAIYAFFAEHVSVPALIYAELITIVPADLVPALLRVPESRRREPGARPAPREAPPRVWPAPDLCLPVTLGSGCTVFLRPETIAGDAFTTADLELIHILFRDGASIEQVCVAIQWACAQHYLARLVDPSRGAVLTVSELAALIRTVGPTRDRCSLRG